MLASSARGLVIFALLLFLPAWTIAWPQGWIFIGLFTICGNAIGIWLLRRDPALLAERMKSGLSRDQRPRDRAIILALIWSMALWLIFMGFDHRFGWSSVPLWAQVAGAALMIWAFAGWKDVLAANTFATTEIRVQGEREQHVVSSGPYAVVRHPMYAYMLPLAAGTALLLGSSWGLIWVIAFTLLVAARAVNEEELLVEGLPGYREYAAKVRFRLIPGVW